jgi:hypothetical protein
MATLTPTTLAASGTAATLAAANSAGDRIQWQAVGVKKDNTYHGGILLVANGSGSGITVTIKNQRTSNLGNAVDRTVSVGAGKTEHIAIRDHEVDAANRTYLEYSGVTTVTVGVFILIVRS